MNKSDDEWKVYRSSFLIRAKQLIQPLVFVDPFGHEHRGKKGDYLVQHVSGLQRIWPRQLFEDSHVALSATEFNSAPQDWLGAASGNGLTSLAKPVKSVRKAASCGKTATRSRIPAVNCLRYNI